ncbi:hypothetical protein JTM42_34330, partial [Pseudomonas aeruginosa]|nr:hypothetical protein [Pseudomonas aeruginosa]
LLTAPELLLLDEPLASLDIPRKRELLPYLQRLAQEIHIPMLYVSHSLDEIQHLADRVLVLEAGKVKAFGPLEEVWSSSVMHPWLPTAVDITDNPHNLKIMELEGAQLPRVLDDPKVDVAIISTT